MDRVTWRLQRYAGAGPFHVEQVGHVWMVLNERGVNVAHTDDGRIYFFSQASAERALADIMKGQHVPTNAR